MRLDGKKAVITGAASGIGLALLEGLSHHETGLVAADINQEGLQTVISELGSDDIYPFACDLSDREDIDKLFDLALEKMDGIDLFIANAGIPYYEKISGPDWDHISKIFEINVFSAIYSLEKMMHLSDRFHFVVTNSGMAKMAIPGYALYSSTKAALDRFFQGFDLEKERDITVSIVYPVATSTDFFSRAGKRAAPVPWPCQTPEKVAAAVIKGIERDKKYIYPTQLLKLTSLPLVKWWYQKREKKRFMDWLRKNE